ncbi:hypothetical protein [Micromonospora schwarzwaldensis]|uniref:hypothetical protein n=1 Tax=Micromonospora sp. DSM 45708 TaxID=3111767 RepID=UPI0031D84F00
MLLNLASRLTADRCDTLPGRFAVVHHRLWRYDTNSTRETDVVRWYAADDSGAELARRSPNRQITQDWWRPGELRVRNLTNAYLTSEWLITQAHMQGWGDGPAALVEGLAALATWHNPGQRQRRLATRVLADTSGLTAHPAVTDRAGRRGVGITAFTEQGHTRHLLILDSDTGQILAYEVSTLTATGWRAQIYLLLLTRTHTPRRWWEPSTANNPAAPPRRYLHPRHSPVWLIHQDQPCLASHTDDGARS